MRLKKVQALGAYIPTASMADIAFLLIIFFMVTTKFDVDRTRVPLPKSSFREEVPKGSAYVVIHREEGGYIYKFSNGEDVSQALPDMTALAAQVNALAQTSPGKPYVIKADNDTPYRMIDETLETLRRAGVETVIMLTEQKTVQDAS